MTYTEKLNTTNHTAAAVRKFLKIFAFVTLMGLSYRDVYSQDNKLVIQLAKLQIDSAQLDNYKSLLKEGIEAAIRVEPGVLTLYAVYEKDHPNRVTVFEVYANEEAYKSHLQTPHFKKYKTSTKDMVRSLELIKVDPIALGRKPK